MHRSMAARLYNQTMFNKETANTHTHNNLESYVNFIDLCLALEQCLANDIDMLF